MLISPMRTSVNLSQEQLRKLALFCRREKISRAEAVRRAVDRFLQSSSVPDLRSFFGASRTRGNISRQVARLRREWSRRNRCGFDYKRVRHLVGSIAGEPKHWKKDCWRKQIRQHNWR
ncbi:MAG: hypothetical protein DMF38_14850 [Verrucomicrobia bacterium]|nr:MAG: hypothetical protein DMF38_14850 [Verrucomicrobiota bacterium]